MLMKTRKYSRNCWLTCLTATLGLVNKNHDNYHKYHKLEDRNTGDRSAGKIRAFRSAAEVKILSHQGFPNEVARLAANESRGLSHWLSGIAHSEDGNGMRGDRSPHCIYWLNLNTSMIAYRIMWGLFEGKNCNEHDVSFPMKRRMFETDLWSAK